MNASAGFEDRRVQAERSMRQGDFRSALAAYRALQLERPDDPRISARVRTLEENLQPMELMHPKADAGGRGPTDLSDLQAGEAAANAGDFREAVCCYERICSKDPSNELAGERLSDLRSMVKESKASPTPLPEPPRPQLSDVATPPLRASPNPRQLLETLMSRVAQRRRVPAQLA